MKFRKILFPTDFSPWANKAFDYTCALARELEAELVLIHVFHVSVNEAGKVPPEDFEKLLEEKRKEIQERFEVLTSKTDLNISITKAKNGNLVF